MGARIERGGGGGGQRFSCWGAIWLAGGIVCLLNQESMTNTWRNCQTEFLVPLIPNSLSFLDEVIRIQSMKKE